MIYNVYELLLGGLLRLLCLRDGLDNICETISVITYLQSRTSLTFFACPLAQWLDVVTIDPLEELVSLEPLQPYVVVA